MGEDYQIVYTTAESVGIVIGRVEEGNGVFLVKDDKKERLSTKGYEHFISH